MQNELDIVRDVSQRLDTVKIGYMLTGSMAMNYYAQPRMTRDIDVVVALRPADAARGHEVGIDRLGRGGAHRSAPRVRRA